MYEGTFKTVRLEVNILNNSSKNIKSFSILWKTCVMFVMMMITVLPASAAINLNYSNIAGIRNYTINNSVLNSTNFISYNGNIELPTLSLTFEIDKILQSDSKTLVIKADHFGPQFTDLPKQKIFVVDNGTAIVNFTINASKTNFGNKNVNVKI